MLSAEGLRTVAKFGLHDNDRCAADNKTPVYEALSMSSAVHCIS